VIGISLLELLSGAGLIAAVLLLINFGALTPLAQLVVGIYVLTGALYVVLAVMLLRGAPWARTVSIVLAALNVATWIAYWLMNSPLPLHTFAANALVLILLNLRPVAEWCYPQ
jgi:hypothetical protein